MLFQPLPLFQPMFDEADFQRTCHWPDDNQGHPPTPSLCIWWCGHLMLHRCTWCCTATPDAAPLHFCQWVLKPNPNSLSLCLIMWTSDAAPLHLCPWNFTTFLQNWMTDYFRGHLQYPLTTWCGHKKDRRRHHFTSCQWWRWCKVSVPQGGEEECWPFFGAFIAFLANILLVPNIFRVKVIYYCSDIGMLLKKKCFFNNENDKFFLNF